jgi:hypothetical protein
MQIINIWACYNVGPGTGTGAAAIFLLKKDPELYKIDAGVHKKTSKSIIKFIEWYADAFL